MPYTTFYYITLHYYITLRHIKLHYILSTNVGTAPLLAPFFPAFVHLACLFVATGFLLSLISHVLERKLLVTGVFGEARRVLGSKGSLSA
jgi:hypothetical protein